MRVTCGSIRIVAAKRTDKQAREAADETVAVRVPEPLRHRAKVYAAQSKRELQDVLAEILDEGLKKRGA